MATSDERRVSGRVEEILHGWWRISEDEKFQRCRSLDLSMDGALIVLDTLVEPNTKFALHLDIEDDWSMELAAEALWQRPIFFGKQQLTAVRYRFHKTEDRSMFGLWLQKKLVKKRGVKSHLAPTQVTIAKTDSDEVVLGEVPKIELVEDFWRKALSQMTSKIPWLEGEAVPNDRRSEARAQVGLTLRLEFPKHGVPVELLNVSLSGASVFVADDEVKSGPKGLNSSLKRPGKEADLVLCERSLLIGGRRCPVETVWSQDARKGDADATPGRVLGLRIRCQPLTTRKTFVGDLLRRLNYNHKQVRSELRFPSVLPVVVSLGKGVEIRGETVDLGAGGARLKLLGEVPVPGSASVRLTLPKGPGQVYQISLSVRVLRKVSDEKGDQCYTVAFRKGQMESHLELSRWLARRMRVQNLDELVPELNTPKDKES